MLKRCKVFRCPNLHTNKSGYCDVHQALYKSQNVNKEKKQSSTNKAYSTYAWYKFSHRFLQKHKVCAICGGKAEVCDHKDMPAEIMLDINNGKFILDEKYYQPLCIRCNTIKGKQDRKKVEEYFKNKEELNKKFDV